jgi:hypothetical protein
MWDLANIMVYIDSVLALESTVNLEIDMPGAEKKIQICNIWRSGNGPLKLRQNTLKQVSFYSSICSVAGPSSRTVYGVGLQPLAC